MNDAAHTTHENSARLLKSRNYNYILMCEGIEIL